GRELIIFLDREVRQAVRAADWGGVTAGWPKPHFQRQTCAFIRSLPSIVDASASHTDAGA
ncbi:MAG: hypothetical protein OEU26_09030, partial [Candidatus Tectomicrobia bacterium]|nr:hypothetical protein [Candidatus Tectomicrobia bacterium]